MKPNITIIITSLHTGGLEFTNNNAPCLCNIRKVYRKENDWLNNLESLKLPF